jgi:hypothetical protein
MAEGEAVHNDRARPRGPRLRSFMHARAIALTTFTILACDTHDPTGPSVTILSVPLLVTVTVTNTRFGTAVPADFTIAAKNNAGFWVTWQGTKNILVPGNGPYEIVVTAAPDGYTETLSASCSGAVPHAGLSPCVVTATELPLSCDDTLWALTYRLDRLKILNVCEVASGIVEQSSLERDGDLVLRVVPDPRSQALLREGNAALQNRLVIEMPCQGPIDQADALGTCGHYQGRAVSVPIGAHIVAAAHHVQDRNHGMWAELHGATIRVLPR